MLGTMISAKHCPCVLLAASALLACGDTPDPGDATDGQTSAADTSDTGEVAGTTTIITTAAATNTPTTSGADATGNSGTSAATTGDNPTRIVDWLADLIDGQTNHIHP